MGNQVTDKNSVSVDKVGYKHPPKRTQFLKGQSGNPSGRPKTKHSRGSLLRKALNERIVLNRGDRRKFISMDEARYKRVVHMAARGDMAAQRLLETMCRTLLKEENETTDVQKNMQDLGLAIRKGLYGRAARYMERLIRAFHLLPPPSGSNPDVILVITEEDAQLFAKRMCEAWGLPLAASQAIGLVNAGIALREDYPEEDDSPEEKVKPIKGLRPGRQFNVPREHRTKKS